MIQIDGNYLEGGGQIIRTALSLAAITNQSFRIDNVRAGRKNPGLREQHLQAVNSIAKLCNAKHDANFGSTKFKFTPKTLSRERKFNINIGTAGSTALIISTILPLAYKLNNPINVKIDGGGTWNIFAPPVIYLQKVLIPILSKIDFKANVRIMREGFYPKGGAKVELNLLPWKTKKHLNLTEHNVKKIEIYSVASESLKDRNVAERQMEKVVDSVKKFSVTKTIKYIDSICSGSGILIKSSPTILAGDAVGRRGKSSEEVAREAIEKLQSEILAEVGVDHRAADQLMIYMAIIGEDGGKLKTSRISNHSRTNAYVIEKFLPVKFKFVKNTIICAKI